MILRTSGKPLKADLKECKLAAKFAANQLFSSRLRGNIHVKLIFTEKDTETDDCYGYCAYWRYTSPHEFVIGVNPKLPRARLLKTIFHEFTHVEQYATGRLTDNIENKTDPLEREARRLEVKLYKQFKEMTR